MSEPTEAIYDAAYQAFKGAPLGSSIVRTIVDTVWPLAQADALTELAERLDRLATGASLDAERYKADIPSRIEQTAKARAYTLAARIARGEV